MSEEEKEEKTVWKVIKTVGKIATVLGVIATAVISAKKD